MRNFVSFFTRFGFQLIVDWIIKNTWKQMEIFPIKFMFQNVLLQSFGILKN